MDKVIKIKESKVLGIINNIINEQEASAGIISVSASNSLGAIPNFDGLKVLMTTLRSNVEKALRADTPYTIKRNTQEGVIKASKEGDSLKLSVTLVPSKEEDRDWFFDFSLAIYSSINTDSVDYLKAKVLNKAANKAEGFNGAEDQVNVLGKNTINLDMFQGLDPNNATKIYKLYIVCIGAKRPEGYQQVAADTKAPETAPAAEKVADAPVAAAAEQPVTKKQLNEVVTSGYTASNCDELHAFQSTGGKVIGNMNVIVGNKLAELYKAGHNPKVTDVKVTVKGLTVNWTCTITESTDGKAWVGFTSRGAGCNNNVIARAESKESGNDVGTATEKIKSTYGEDNIDIEKVGEAYFNGGNNSFRQVFYAYTRPKQFPAK